MRDTVRKFGDMTKGPAKRVRDVASTLSNVIPADQIRDAASGLVRAGRDAQIVQVVRSEIERRLRSLGLASKDEVDRLKRRIQALEERPAGRTKKSPKKTAKKARTARAKRAPARARKKAPARKGKARKAKAPARTRARRR